MTHPPSVTEFLIEIADERRPASDGLALVYPIVYEELRRLARSLMRDQRSSRTLTPTALVHEAYLRLVDQTRIRPRSRAQFFCLAAKAMRSILVDHARRRGARKRGGGWQRIPWDESVDAPDAVGAEVLALHRALEDLAAKDGRMAEIVEMRVFGGLTVTESAEMLGVSPRTVDNDWRVAKAWLADRMSTSPSP